MPFARIALAVLIVATAAPARAAAAPADEAAPLRPADYAVFQAFQSTITAVSAKVIPSVVYIEAVQKINNRKQKVSGSGFVAGADGIIITNEHVVEKAQKVEVTLLGDKRKYKATVVGMDEQTDIAVLKIDAPQKLPVPPMGDYKNVRVGEGVLAIGNPYGLDGTVSFGIVSAKGRNLNVGTLINDFLQTDAMIDHGSSGGPLVNLRGEIVGVNSMGQGRGIGFTIPINTALDVRDRLLNGGVHRGWLGVTVQPLNRDLADFWQQPELTGAIVTHVIGGSPAGVGGVRPEDIIVEINGEAIDVEDEKDLNRFRRVVAAVPPGTKVPVKVLRGGKPKTLAVAIGVQPKLEGDDFETEFGFTGQEITASLQVANRLTDREGVFVSFVEKDSVAAEAGVIYGEVVLHVNDQRIRNLADFKAAMAGIEPESRFLIKARAGDSLRYHLLMPYAAKKRGADR